jgi:hypothetical protein
MVQHQLIWCRDCKQHHFWLKFADSLPSFDQLKPKNEVGMAGTDWPPQEHVSHPPNITHWTHMDDMKWFCIN